MNTVRKPGIQWNRAVLPSLAVIIFFYLLIFVKPVLYLHAQETPFLKGGAFFSRFLQYPGGLLEYFSRFITQGFASNFFGALIILILLACIFLLCRLLLRRISNTRAHGWSLLLPLLTLAMMQDYLFPVIIHLQLILILISTIIVHRSLGNSIIGWIAFPVLYLMNYYLSGPGASLIYSLSIFVLVLISGNKKTLTGLMVLVVSVLVPWLAYQWVFNLSLYDAYFWIVPDLSVTVEYRITPAFILYMLYLPAVMLMVPIKAKIYSMLPQATQALLGRRSILILWLVVAGAGSVFLLQKASKPMIRTAILCDYYNFTGAFQQTVDLALNTKEQYDISVNVSYVRAIARQGNITDNLFEYPQLIGSMAMQPDRLGSPEFMHAASDFYLDLGYISESQHFAYADLAINPDNLRSKKRLVFTNILMGNYGAAETFLNSITRHPGQKKFVDRYRMFVRDTNLVMLDPWFSNMRSLMPPNFTVPAQFTERMKDLVNYNEKNVLAVECLQICHMLDHDLGLFMRFLPGSLSFYNEIPDLYQQAMIMYYYNTEQPGLDEFPISNTNKQQFNTFVNTIASAGNNKEQARNMLGSLTDTYMYYITYLSPRVTNVKLIQQ